MSVCLNGLECGLNDRVISFVACWLVTKELCGSSGGRESPGTCARSPWL